MIVQRILELGVSPFLILATDSVILIVLNTVLQTYGGPEEGDLLITCATIVQSYMMLITGPMLGISSGTQAILSYNYGAKNIDRVKSAEKYILLLCLCFTTLMFLVSRTVPEYFIRIFTRDPGQTDLCIWGIHVFTLMIIPLSFQYVFVDGFTALGRSRTALFLSVFRKGDYILFTIVLPIFWGARSAFYAQPLADGISADPLGKCDKIRVQRPSHCIFRGNAGKEHAHVHNLSHGGIHEMYGQIAEGLSVQIKFRCVEIIGSHIAGNLFAQKWICDTLQ